MSKEVRWGPVPNAGLVRPIGPTRVDDDRRDAGVDEVVLSEVLMNIL